MPLIIFHLSLNWQSIADNIVTAVFVVGLPWMGRQLWLYTRKRAREAAESKIWQEKMLRSIDNLGHAMHSLTRRVDAHSERLDKHSEKLKEISQKLYEKGQ